MSNKILTNPKYVSGKTAKEILQCSDNTLRRWANENKIDFTRYSEKGKRFYNVDKFIASNSNSTQNVNEKRDYCYCRVSTQNQKDDLQRQIAFMREKYPNAIIIKDIGSGINWKRRGLLSLLQQVKNNQVERIIVSHKDRLCRFAFELIEYFCSLFQTKIMVLDSSEKSANTELADDILSIIHIFSCKKMGKRRYNTNESDTVNENSITT